MLVSTENGSAIFCTLVEHPGGADGGEFPQYHRYAVADDGSLLYATEYPESSTDNFQDESRSEHTECATREGALTLLRERLADLETAVNNVRKLVACFEQDKPFTVYFADEEYNEDLDEDEDDEDDEDEAEDDDDNEIPF